MDGIRQKRLNEAKNTTMAIKKENDSRPSASATSDQQKKAEKFEELAPYTKVLLSWKAPEFREFKKTENWYLWLGVIAAILITISIFLGAYIVATTFFLLAIIIVMYAQKSPDSVETMITDTGIVYQERFYPYNKLTEFWIFYDPPHVTTLNFQQKDALKPNLEIQIHDEDPVDIREVLLEYVVENEEKEEDFTAAMARRLKF